MNLHHTVLRTEAVSALHIQPTGAYIDATLGSGGHAREILSQLGKDNTFLGIDADQTAIDEFTNQGFPKTAAHVLLEHSNFSKLSQCIEKYNLSPIRGILADLGWRMDQFAHGGKGFSFQTNEPLYMTYGDPSAYAFTAYDVVNDWAETDIANVIFAYGEERRARTIARAIVTTREERPITTSLQLAELVEQTIRRDRKSRLHPATKTFQALRIVVNDELDVLEQFITESFDCLAPQGRLAIITFHSLEDRVVKHRFRSLAQEQVGKLLTKKPIVASEEEVADNPRSRSAKLRIIEKI